MAKVVHSAPSEGKEIADKFGEDLSFASKQVIRGFTAIFAPLLDSAQDIPQVFSKYGQVGSHKAQGVGEAQQNFQRVLLRDGVNALGKGVKASATILSSPARVLGTGIEEFKKVGHAGIEPKFKVDSPGSGDLRSGINDGSKIASTLLNTTASEFSQANLGAVLVELAFKNRIKDIGNKTLTYVESNRGQKVEPTENKDSTGAVNEAEQTTKSSAVDALIEQFNEAVRNNDERVLEALKVVLAKINPPKQ